ncbi:hypothetical protein EVAR_10461_1 [Eumeta japonica]|uniref:Uncharacterized protein n=1 Tax=Eumeta variegata TaxID=151549 RepID=A0A4C1TJX0_EUMVA|nr:hypothetical protein EVAR_10461_1 [Eumeta japonica]
MAPVHWVSIVYRSYFRYICQVSDQDIGPKRRKKEGAPAVSETRPLITRGIFITIFLRFLTFFMLQIDGFGPLDLVPTTIITMTTFRERRYNALSEAHSAWFDSSRVKNSSILSPRSRKPNPRRKAVARSKLRTAPRSKSNVRQRSNQDHERDFWLRHNNGSARPVKYHTLPEYGCEVAASAVTFRPLSKSPEGILLPLPLHHPDPPSISYLIPFQKASNTSAIALELEVSIGADDHLLSDSLPAPLLHDYKKNHEEEQWWD